tara:strand:+ start:462 stop:641 length:180 start_codon:yes stop_codon:yes gene_type:complete
VLKLNGDVKAICVPTGPEFASVSLVKAILELIILMRRRIYVSFSHIHEFNVTFWLLRLG